MTPGQLDVARRWLRAFYDEVDAVQAGSIRDSHAVLKLTKDRVIQWTEDKNYDGLLRKI